MAAYVNKEPPFAVCEVERDVHGDDLCTWCFPSVSGDLQNICVKRCATDGKASNEFYFKVKNDWLYVQGRSMAKGVSVDVEHFFVCVVTRVFNPEKYMAFLKLLADNFSKSGDPTKVLEGYLSVNTTGKYSNAAGSFTITSFKDENVFKFDSNLKAMIAKCGVEFVIVWNALFLKRRILLVSADIGLLQQSVRSLPLLLNNARRDWSILRPVVRDEPEHIDDLQSAGIYIAGTADESLASRSDMFDVVVSLDEGQVNIPSHAQTEMALCGMHKDIGGAMLELAESATSADKDIIEVVVRKATNILTQLRSLSEGKLSVAIINENVANKASQQWLCRVAAAEGLI